MEHTLDHTLDVALEHTRPQTTEYFGPISSDIWKDGTGFIESAKSILKPIKYLASNCEVPFHVLVLVLYIQGYWCLSA